MVAKRQVRAARKPGLSKKKQKIRTEIYGHICKKKKKKSLEMKKKKKSQPPELNKKKCRIPVQVKEERETWVI